MSYVLCPIFNIMPFSINCSELDKDQARAWLYIFAMYTMILPILFWRMRYLLSEHVVPSQPLSKRLIISIIALFLGPILLFIPFIVMVLGADNLGRAGLIYIFFVNSFLGLFIVGAAMFFSVSLFLWCLFVGVKKIWFSPIDENKIY